MAFVGDTDEVRKGGYVLLRIVPRLNLPDNGTGVENLPANSPKRVNSLPLIGTRAQVSRRFGEVLGGAS